ncbi:MAG: carbon storage regulator [Legionella sp.]|jgi:carbon storage regulator|nr:MAG: carbon storage regulator [Legionella sp.]
MLVLSRKIGERILIGEDIYLVALGIQKGSMRFGIEAPKSVNIVREELLGRDEKSTSFWQNLLLKSGNKNSESFVNRL